MNNYQEKRADKAWDKLSVLQEVFAGLMTTCKNDGGRLELNEGLLAGLQEITQSIVYDVQAAVDSVEFHPELKQYETSLLEKELADRKQMEERLASRDKETTDQKEAHNHDE